MRVYRLLPALAFAALLGFSASGVQAGRFFGRGYDGSDNTYPYSNRPQDSFGFGPVPQYQARQPTVRHRLFHRNQPAANYGMPANAVSGYAMPPANDPRFGYVQTPMVQPSFQTQPFQMTYAAPAQVRVAPAVQSPPCRACGQSAQAPSVVPATPVMQSRLVPMPAGPTTAEPPQADVTGRVPF